MNILFVVSLIASSVLMGFAASNLFTLRTIRRQNTKTGNLIDEAKSLEGDERKIMIARINERLEIIGELLGR